MAISLGNSASSELFDNYEREYQIAHDEIFQKLDEFDSVRASSEQKALIQSVERAIEETYEIIDQMAVEVQSIPSASRSPYNNKLRGYRSEIDKAKREIRKKAESADRSSLFGARDGANAADSGDAGSNQRQSLLGAQQTLERSGERLRESQRIANETEGVGASILTDLRGQREQLHNTRNTLSEADSNVDRSLRTLRTMARRLTANRFITMAIIAVLVILIIFVILSKFW